MNNNLLSINFVSRIVSNSVACSNGAIMFEVSIISTLFMYPSNVVPGVNVNEFDISVPITMRVSGSLEKPEEIDKDRGAFPLIEYSANPVDGVNDHMIKQCTH